MQVTRGSTRRQVVLALDFGGSKIAAAVCDTSGKRLAEHSVPTVAADGATANFDRGISTARALLDSLGDAALVAVGACTFGIPGPSGVALAPTIPGWGELRLEIELGRAFENVPVRVATDVKAAAQAETQSGALAGCDPGIYLNLGTGLAAAVVVNGAVVSGRHGSAGEIGYNLRYLTDVGRPGTERELLEDAVSGMGLTRRAGATNAVTAAQIFAGAAHQPRWAHLVSEFVAELAFHLVNLTIAVDPARIVVGGGIAAAWDQLHGGLRRALDAAVPYPRS